MPVTRELVASPLPEGVSLKEIRQQIYQKSGEKPRRKRCGKQEAHRIMQDVMAGRIPKGRGLYPFEIVED